MDIGVLVAILLNIAVSIFSAGKLYQKVKDLSDRILSLERKMENTDEHLDNVTERLARLEGRLEATPRLH